MPQNLFAACRTDGGELIAKRVRLDANVQQAIEAVFTEQETAFREGVTDEMPFDGSWTPNEDEFLTIEVPAEAQIFADTINANAIAVADIDTAAFSDEGIKALFTGVAENGATKVLVQRFTSQQVLERRFALLQQGNTFRRLTESAFALDNSLACLIEDGKIKFKSQHKLRSIINMLDIYRAATDQEVHAFAAHESLEVEDVANFVSTTNQVSRKLIHAITNNETLDNHAPADIQAAARETDLAIVVRNGRIVVPTAHSEIKALLQFLNESRYSGPLSGQPFVTNSQRPA
ncbi:Kiwa anti-phage protein KwaB-like domain-containing protein [Salinisphaera hydrothermalis]|uniref:Kiwa anti-phage protein KwaB-like domain-containing protein n=1 Tax=Salinisphaera hydrothermalis TaxID=563188 RepID=UPI00334045BA